MSMMSHASIWLGPYEELSRCAPVLLLFDGWRNGAGGGHWEDVTTGWPQVAPRAGSRQSEAPLPSLSLECRFHLHFPQVGALCQGRSLERQMWHWDHLGGMWLNPVKAAIWPFEILAVGAEIYVSCGAQVEPPKLSCWLNQTTWSSPSFCSLSLPSVDGGQFQISPGKLLRYRANKQRSGSSVTQPSLHN